MVHSSWHTLMPNTRKLSSLCVKSQGLPSRASGWGCVMGCAYELCLPGACLLSGSQWPHQPLAAHICVCLRSEGMAGWTRARGPRLAAVFSSPFPSWQSMRETGGPNHALVFQPKLSFLLPRQCGPLCWNILRFFIFNCTTPWGPTS